LKKGDVATIVEHHPSDTSEDGYSLEVFNVLGNTIAVLTVSEIDWIHWVYSKNRFHRFSHKNVIYKNKYL